MASTAKITINIDDDILLRVKQLVVEDSSTLTNFFECALRRELDYRYLKDKATVLPQEITEALQASLNLLEHRINNRTNKVLSELAIQQGIIAMVLADSLELAPDLLDRYRVLVVEQVKTSNRVLRLTDVVDDA